MMQVLAERVHGVFLGKIKFQVVKTSLHFNTAATLVIGILMESTNSRILELEFLK